MANRGRERPSGAFCAPHPLDCDRPGPKSPV